MSPLPHKEFAEVDRTKLVDYLLSTSQMPGAAKAKFFMAFGFTIEQWGALRVALLDHGKNCPVVAIKESPYGCKYEIEGAIISPDGRNPRIRSVWQIDKGELAPRLITAYPA